MMKLTLAVQQPSSPEAPASSLLSHLESMKPSPGMEWVSTNIKSGIAMLEGWGWSIPQKSSADAPKQQQTQTDGGAAKQQHTRPDDGAQQNHVSVPGATKLERWRARVMAAKEALSRTLEKKSAATQQCISPSPHLPSTNPPAVGQSTQAPNAVHPVPPLPRAMPPVRIPCITPDSRMYISDDLTDHHFLPNHSLRFTSCLLLLACIESCADPTSRHSLSRSVTRTPILSTLLVTPISFRKTLPLIPVPRVHNS